MRKHNAKFLGTLTALALGLGLATAAPAATVLVGTYSGNDCGGAGGFSNCYASQSGTSQGASGELASPAVYKYNNGGAEDFSNLFPSVDGSEFDITYNGGTNTLSFTYTPGADDPAIHYFTVKQANGFALFYDALPITSGSVTLDDFFPRTPGYSHITFFDTGGGVPEPATWAIMIMGIGIAGGAMRLRQARTAIA